MAWCSPSRSTMRELSYSFIWQPWVSMKSLRVMLRAGVVQKMTGDYMPTTEQGKARVDAAGFLDCSGDLRRVGGLQLHQVVAEDLPEDLGGNFQLVATHLSGNRSEEHTSELQSLMRT